MATGGLADTIQKLHQFATKTRRAAPQQSVSKASMTGPWRCTFPARLCPRSYRDSGSTENAVTTGDVPMRHALTIAAFHGPTDFSFEHAEDYIDNRHRAVLRIFRLAGHNTATGRGIKQAQNPYRHSGVQETRISSTRSSASWVRSVESATNP
jgi:hypothetical protein